MSDESTRFHDVIPYDTPRSLEALRGPATGTITLPRTVHWGPQAEYDLNIPGHLDLVYRTTVREGTPELQEALLNANILRTLWPDLQLPTRCRSTWEHKFPELRT